MALEEFKYLMIDSEDFWGYDDGSYDEESNWYQKVFVVPKAEVEAKPSLISDLNLMPCAMFFLKDNEDDQRFTPTSIKVDTDRMIAIVEGEQKRIGEDIKDPIRPMVFRLDALAPPYKNMNEYKKMTSGRFKVDNMIFDNDDEDFEKPKKQLEDLTQYSESFTEEVVAEAEFFNAETLERINPTIVEGAEDIMGAENETFKSSNHDVEIMEGHNTPLADTNVFGPGVNENVIGQEYVGRVLGQDAEGDDGIAGFFPDGDGRVIGSITADAQFEPLGANAEGFDDRDDESIGERHRGNHKQSLKDRRDESKAMTAKGDPHHPYADVGTMDAEFFPDGDGRIFGSITPTAQFDPLGFNAEGLDNDILSAEYDAESNEVSFTTLHGENFTLNADTGVFKNAEGTFDAEESEALSAEDLTIVMNAAGYVPSGEWGSMHPAEANQDYQWAFRNAEHEGYDDRDDESIGERNRGKHKQSLKDRKDESKAMTAKGDPHHPFSDVSTMSAEYVTDEGVLMGAAQSTRELLEDRDTDIVDLVQDAPFIRDFRLSGWATSALILGTAWVFGRRSMAKKESKDAEIEVSRTVGDVGGGNDFGQDPVMIQEDNKRHFFPHKVSGINEIDPSSPLFNPLSQSYRL